MTRARDLSNLIGSGNYTSTTFTATAGQTVFTIAHTQGFIQVFMNGLLLDETTDYTSNGTAVTLTEAATAGDELEVVKYNTFSVGDAITQTDADTRYVNASGDTMTGELDVTTGGYTARGLELPRVGTSVGSVQLGYDGSNGIVRTWMSSPIKYQTYGTHQFETAGTKRMEIDSAGRVTMPYQPAFTAHYSGGTIANGTVIGWNSTDYNTGGHYSTSTGRFTAPVAGKYAFFVQVHHSSGSGYTAAHQYFDIRKNGGTFHRFIGRWTVDDWYELTAQRVVELSAGDYVDVLVFSANNQWMGSNRPDHNHFTGYLIG